jgi:hypothetical protein
MPPRKTFRFGRKAKHTKHVPPALRYCEECGAVLRANGDGHLVCTHCSPSQGRRQDEQADGDHAPPGWQSAMWDLLDEFGG